MNEMYNRIENLCKQNGVNVTRMCKEANIPRGNLSDLKHGRTAALSTKTLGKISEYFGVPIERLLGTEEVDASLFANNLSRHMSVYFDSSEKLASSTGIPVETIEEFISGSKNPKMNDVEKIAKSLNVEKEDLTDVWTTPMDSIGHYTIEDVDFDTYDIVGKYMGLTPAQKKTVRQVIETILWGKPGQWKY